MAEANAINANTTGIVGNTGTAFVGTPTTAHNLLVGGGTSSTLVNVAPSATSGVPVISQGAAADPAFGTAVVAGGGTGAASFNTTGVVISGATSTTALSSVTLTDGQLVIGSSTGNPAAASLTAGTGISITPGHNSISVASTVVGGIATINGDSGNVTGSTVTLTSATVNNVASKVGIGGTSTVSGNVGHTTLTINATDVNANTGLGGGALPSVTASTGAGNTCIGQAGGFAVTTGGFNTSIGQLAFSTATTGANNTALGWGALRNTNGDRNVAVGFTAGTNYSGTESSNIVIGNGGVGAESNVIRIGTQGAGASQQNQCFVAGITGVTVASSAAVLLNTTTGQLGTIISSRRYKENIKDIDSSILSLRPVEFNYKGNQEKSFGLIAEEVEKVMPELVVYKEGQPETVKYQLMYALLLKEIQRLNERINKLEMKLS